MMFDKKIKKTALFLVISLCCAASVCAEQLTLPVVGLGRSAESPVMMDIEWDEKWFGQQPSTVYNHNLARIASLLTINAYGDATTNSKINNIKNTYEIMGFDDKDMEFHYDIDYNNPMWGVDQCAFSIVSKDINSSKGKKKLIVIAIRGTPYVASEWISNLNISDRTSQENPIHEGFSRVAQQVHSALISYLLRRRISPEDTFIFLMGHSRGASVANILASQFVYDDLFNTDDVYVYTFASPNVTTYKDTQDPKFDFIWNIVNGEDCVPFMPFTKNWNYGKYGHILTFVNAWNINPDVYYDKDIPKINKYFNYFNDRDYYPFTTGPFIPVQVMNILTYINPTISRFYNGLTETHTMFQEVLKRIFPESDISVEAAQKGSENFAAWMQEWVNSLTNGLMDYAANAFNDMHAMETYSSHLLGLSEEEAFSTNGFTEIRINSHGDYVITDVNDKVLLKVTDGALDYTSLKIPVAAMQSLNDNVIIGLPCNAEFSFYLKSDRVCPSITKVVINKYSVDGELVETSDAKYLYPRENVLYKFAGGSYTYENVGIAEEKIPYADYYSTIKNVGLEEESKFVFVPDFSLSTDGDFSAEALLGNGSVYGIAGFTVPFGRIGKSFSLDTGVGFDIPFSNYLYFDIQAYLRSVWLTDNTGGNDMFKFVPTTRVTFAWKPRHRFELYVAGAIDWNISYFNAAAFDYSVDQSTFGSFSLSENVDVCPNLQIGVRF